MPSLVVVFNPKDWPLKVPGVDVISATKYLSDDRYGAMRGVRVFNLCRSYRYQNNGYYVSLLAAARGHKPLPSVTTIQAMKSGALMRNASDELDELIQKSLAPLQSDEFDVSIYFGRNLAKRYDRLARNLFNLFPSPLLRARFVRNDKWQLSKLRPISLNDVPQSHGPFLLKVAKEHFAMKRPLRSRRRTARYDLAILYDPTAAEAPSNERAIRKFARAGESMGFAVSMITRDDLGSIGEYDALFIRETTYVNHHTYRFAARAVAEGLAVIDDPESIVRCTNKVFTAEVLQRNNVATPRTLIVHEGNVNQIERELGLPCILKQPDSAFSRGVAKVSTREELKDFTERLLESSDLVIAQEFVPTDFDWRIGVLAGEPLYACRYHMADEHWQIVRRDDGRKERFGKVETMPLEAVPKSVIRTAVRAANHFGNGLYGVDLKQFGRRVVVIEVNDNPNIDAGFEDKILGDELYRRIMAVLMQRVEARGRFR